MAITPELSTAISCELDARGNLTALPAMLTATAGLASLVPATAGQQT